MCIIHLFTFISDSVRQMMKYSDTQLRKQTTATLDTKLDFRFHECKGQRNFYITGFSLFLMLWVNTRRVITEGMYTCTVCIIQERGILIIEAGVSYKRCTHYIGYIHVCTHYKGIYHTRGVLYIIEYIDLFYCNYYIILYYMAKITM